MGAVEPPWRVRAAGVDLRRGLWHLLAGLPLEAIPPGRDLIVTDLNPPVAIVEVDVPVSLIEDLIVVAGLREVAERLLGAGGVVAVGEAVAVLVAGRRAVLDRGDAAEALDAALTLSALEVIAADDPVCTCLLYTSPSPRD